MQQLNTLLTKLGLATLAANTPPPYLLCLEPHLEIKCTPLPQGFACHSSLLPLPTKNREDLLIYLARANLLGQGTFEFVLGIDREEKLLTLSGGFPYEMDQAAFEEIIERFANLADYWREEIATWIQRQSTAPLG